MDANRLMVGAPDPQALLLQIKKAIDARAIATWRYDKDGDFSHTAPEWVDTGWLRPSISGVVLTLTFLPPKSGVKAGAVGVHLGRFAEMLINHFKGSVSYVNVP